MSHTSWRRHNDGSVAVDEILDAAGRTFAKVGVGRATMVDVAREAGCSRATLYRYFPNQEALHLAFVHRATLRIAGRLADERRTRDVPTLSDRIVEGIAAVRADPLLAVWFEPENMAVPMALSQSSELLGVMSAGMLDQLGDADLTVEDLEQRGAWLLRCIVSLLATPGPDDVREREMIETFLVPVLLAQPQPGRNRR